MGIDYSLLHKILKDPTRRNILMRLHESGPTTYMELMALTKVSNTGRFNYHLKVLGDLIEKTGDGKYQLTERGQLSVQLLGEVPEKNKTEQHRANETAEQNAGSKTKRQPIVPKKIALALALVLIIGSAFLIAIPLQQVSSEKLTVEWQQFLPGIRGSSVIQTSDGGYLALGINASIYGSGYDAVYTNQTSIVVKTDSAGNMLWQKTLMLNESNPQFQSVLETIDGGFAFITTGTYESYPAAYLTKTDSAVNIEWSTLLPIYSSDSIFGDYGISGMANAFLQTADGGYAIISTYYVGGGPSIPHIYYVKTDPSGNPQVNRTITGGDALSIVPASDDGYVIICEFPSRGGGSSYGTVKIDVDGNTQWTKSYIQQDSVSSYANGGIATSDGGHLLGGYTIINQDSGWLIKTDSQGSAQWNVTYPSNTAINSITQDRDGGYLFVGTLTEETDAEVYDANTRLFTWVAKIDDEGNMQGQALIATGNHLTHPTSLIQTSDGGVAFVGTWNESYQATVEQQFWLVKMAPFTVTPPVVWFSLEVTAALLTVLAEAAIIVLFLRKRKTQTNIADYHAKTNQENEKA
jgi:DNA-binding transcriptional ArsR family regulator